VKKCYRGTTKEVILEEKNNVAKNMVGEKIGKGYENPPDEDI